MDGETRKSAAATADRRRSVGDPRALAWRVEEELCEETPRQ